MADNTQLKERKPENNYGQLSNIEIDTIGEIMNISMGSAATAVSILLQRQVDITTPQVSVVRSEEFEYRQLEPASGIEIEYVEGLHGSNFMIMSKSDIKKIVSLLIGDNPDGTDDELDEIHISALGEVMNQMMGASSTALATFFNTSINISPPIPFLIDDFKSRLSCAECDEYIVAISFNLHIEEILDSQFISIMSVSFTKDLVKKAMNFESDDVAQAEEIYEEPVNSEKLYEELMEGMKQKQMPFMPQDEKIPLARPEVKPSYEQSYEAAEPPRKVESPSKPAKKVNVQPVRFTSFDEDIYQTEDKSKVNLSLVMGVELSVTVEIGRTKKQVKEILDIKQGSIIELDKQAGEPVDVIVNGQLIARGDVVVIDDNFGVRITEIVSSKSRNI